MITFNCDEQTGIRYGVTSANNYPELCDRIQQNGVSLTAESLAHEVRSAIASTFDYRDDFTAEEYREELRSVLSDWYETSDGVLDELVECESTEDCWDTIVNNGFWDYMDFDEQVFEYKVEKDGAVVEHYQASCLGGALLIWVLKSPETAISRQCSPCCPGAGDLDNLDPDGYETYAIAAEWHEEN